MNEYILKTRFPRASKTFVALNSESPSPKPEQVVRHESLGTKKGKGGNSKRRTVSVTSFRCRLTDPDNLCPKYFIDSLRYAGAIPDDREQDIILQVSQEKVRSYKEERTVIEIL